MKYAKLKEDWTLILELVRQHKDRAAALLVAKTASKTFDSPQWCFCMIIGLGVCVQFDL